MAKVMIAYDTIQNTIVSQAYASGADNNNCLFVYCMCLHGNTSDRTNLLH